MKQGGTQHRPKHHESKKSTHMSIKKINNVSKEGNVQDVILKGFTDSFEFHLLIDFETRSYYAALAMPRNHFVD